MNPIEAVKQMTGAVEMAEGAWMVEDFLQTYVGLCPIASHNTVSEIPVYGVGDTLVPGLLKRVPGAHPSLHYRGNAIRREKVWVQYQPLSDGILRYYYTGWQWRVVDATAHVNDSPLLQLIMDKMNELQVFNHAIYTWYHTLLDGIGQHSDKTNDIAVSGLIGVIRMGPYSREWLITEEVEGQGGGPRRVLSASAARHCYFYDTGSQCQVQARGAGDER